MTSPVIPARLQFQCGHAALVTLPRIKGETAAQRNSRVAGEKTAALARQCDFCAPAVALVEPQLAVMHGEHVEVALSDVVEPTRVEELAVVVSSVAEPPVEVEPELAAPQPIVEAIVIAPIEAKIEMAKIEMAGEPKPARGPRARRQPLSTPVSVVGAQRYVVEYEVERVIRATSIHDALRQVTVMGAVEVLAIALQD
jgi:hypothetical protein